MLQDVVIEKPAGQRTEALGLSIRENPTITVSGKSRALWDNDLVQPHNDISERDQRNMKGKAANFIRTAISERDQEPVFNLIFPFLT
jgi:hypothetical protein